jgi:hypothetical protein
MRTFLSKHVCWATAETRVYTARHRSEVGCYLGLRPETDALYYEHFHFLTAKRILVEPRKDAECTECSQAGLRYGRGDAVACLPCIEG